MVGVYLLALYNRVILTGSFDGRGVPTGSLYSRGVPTNLKVVLAQGYNYTMVILVEVVTQVCNTKYCFSVSMLSGGATSSRGCQWTHC